MGRRWHRRRWSARRRRGGRREGDEKEWQLANRCVDGQAEDVAQVETRITLQCEHRILGLHAVEEMDLSIEIRAAAGVALLVDDAHGI